MIMTDTTSLAIGAAAILVPILGGLVHVVYRLGRLNEKVDGLVSDFDRMVPYVWPLSQATPERPVYPRTGRRAPSVRPPEPVGEDFNRLGN